MLKTRLSAVSIAILAGGVVAGCGTSGKTTSTAPTGSASHSSSSIPNPYGHSSSGGGSSGSSRQKGASSGQKVALITAKKHGDLGTILAYGPKKLTVYLFEADSPGRSNCSGGCAAAWPPVIGTPRAGSGATPADLGTITRSDGSKQVTYKGHPLYMFIKDGDDGDAYGEGVHAFGADWYVLAPSGNKVDKS
jgi:predicted lipoprotein with Yx(FWY)xxD motif